MIAGMPIIVSDAMPDYQTVWYPPTETLVEWEKKDHDWLKYFGFGTYRLEECNGVCEINGTLYMSRRVFEKMSDSLLRDVANKQDRAIFYPVERYL